MVGDAGLKAGDTILTLGTGGVSIFALQIAKAMGATVISTSSSEAKLARLRELGADHVINYKETPAWGAAVMELTGGRGVDHVLEVGGVGTLAQSVAATRVGGHISGIGAVAGPAAEPPPIGMIMLKHIRFQGLIVGSRRQQQDLVLALEATGVRPVIDSSFPLEGLAEAFRHESAGAHFGKICLAY
jgi:NADPH:quinone reductase-like Zn-dependent oxidoreductase